jgi:hypothetical protein
VLKLSKFAVAVPHWILDKRWWVAYLIVNDLLRKELVELVEAAPDDRLMSLVKEHLNAYVEKGTMPPAEIAPAILNMADDLMAGRQPTVRAGDYIGLQTYMRQGKK